MERSPASLRGSGGRFVIPGRIGVAVASLAAVAAIGLGAWAVVASLTANAGPLRVEVVQSGLSHPWDLAFDADGRLLVTERSGTVSVFADAEPNAPRIARVAIPDVMAELESGLMGIAVHERTVFVCATRSSAPEPDDPWRIDVLTAELRPDGTLGTFDRLPLAPAVGAPRHQGCAVEIGPDGHLWIAMGDANLPAGENHAQDPATLNGSVIRLELDGTVPADAPFPSGAYTTGHRNPQGLAFRDDGLVIDVEHGTDVNDEINVIERGANYGYPCVTGVADPGPIPSPCPDERTLSPPAWTSGRPTLATSGATFLPDDGWDEWGGDLVVTTLKEEDLRRFRLGADGTATMVETLLDGRYGRLRAAVIGPDGALYVSTSNGSDDRVLRVTLDAATG